MIFYIMNSIGFLEVDSYTNRDLAEKEAIKLSLFKYKNSIVLVVAKNIQNKFVGYTIFKNGVKL